MIKELSLYYDGSERVLPARDEQHCGMDGEVELETIQEEDETGTIVDVACISGISKGFYDD